MKPLQVLRLRERTGMCLLREHRCGGQRRIGFPPVSYEGPFQAVERLGDEHHGIHPIDTRQARSAPLCTHGIIGPFFRRVTRFPNFPLEMT